MKNENFCHLHVHDEYSALDGYGTADSYATKAQELGFKYLALTNHGNIDGLIKFQKACQKHEIIPILGAEGYIVPEEGSKDKSGHIICLVKNQIGFSSLCKNLTYANKHNFYYKPRFSFNFLLNNCEGLIISTACTASFIRKFESGKKFFYDLFEKIQDDLYCEIMPHKMTEQKELNKTIIELANKVGCKVIATNDCHYVEKKDWKIHEILLAVQTKQQWNDPKRWKFPMHGLHLKTVNEMIKSLKEINCYKKEYLTNTIEIAEKCSGYLIPKRQIKLPKIEKTKERENKKLLNLCHEALNKLIKNKNKVAKIRYTQRLKEEYDLIVNKKFSGYFLIVKNLIDWCKKNNILISPGRGSVGGSLVAYLLKITAIDPIKYKLLFSRFINMDRIDYPDIDIDFEDRKRSIVKQHLESIYGKKNVAGVSSFNTMKSKAVIKDVSRVFGIPHQEVNNFTKLIDPHNEKTNEIQSVIENTELGKKFQNKYPEIVKASQKLEGQVRNPSKHAAALILSRTAIGEEDGRCNLAKRGDSFLVNWEKNDTEYVGLMKLDILGLKLLSILSETLSLIKKNTNQDIDLNEINYEDKKTLKEISQGNTIGLFQLSAWATTELIKKINIDSFSVVYDVIALVRPGPTNSGMTSQYIKRKKGASWEKKHPIYEKITKDTFGLLIYQEQVMEVISKIAGLPYSTADKIRKIIGKKRDPKEFKIYEKVFLDGCKKTKYFNKKEAKVFWNGLQAWAFYGFNKAHSVGYAMLGLWSAYLKTHYPTEFICASLTYGASNKKTELVEEAYRIGLSLNLPKVGISESFNWVAKKKRLFIPFIEVKGIGDVIAKQITNPTTKNNIHSFFGNENVQQINRFSGALKKILDEIGAYNFNQKDIQVSDKVKSYFDFRVVSDPKQHYRNLFLVFKNNLRLDKINDATNGGIKLIKNANSYRRLIKNTSETKNNLDKILSCTKCQLRDECLAPIPPIPGKKNIFIIGEAPGKQENEMGELFVGGAGKILWKSLKKYDQNIFYKTNVVKCFPSVSKKPNKKQIEICSDMFLKKEIDRFKPKVILAFGNTSLYFFIGQESGIMKMSGKTLWIEEFACWVVFCIHPASTIYNEENTPIFKKGIKAFKQILNVLKI